jgi:mannose-6-phosphate isomerase-like protein (cupin superfamily)
MNFAAKKKVRPFPLTSSKRSPERPPLYTHPYVEVAFMIEDTATITVGNEERAAKAGSIVVIPPDTPHRFVNSGNTTLRQIGIHASPRFIHTNL